VTRKRRTPTGQTIGSIIVGFDQQILRTLPPAEELVVKAKPVRGVSGQAPGLVVVFPEDVMVDAGGLTADFEVDAEVKPDPEVEVEPDEQGEPEL
jgi:hypothetical protein